MLVLSRRLGEQIRIGDDVIVTVVEIQRGRVRLGIIAPKSTEVHRGEVFKRVQQEKKEGRHAEDRSTEGEVAEYEPIPDDVPQL